MSGAAGEPARITDRVARLRALDPEYRSPLPPPPRSAKIELTSRCNYRCVFCASHLRANPHHDMPWTLYERVAGELKSAGVEQLGLFYIGESLLYPRIEEAVRYAKRECKFPYVFLTTNGSLATGDRMARLMSAGLDSVKFALNFADDAQLVQCGGAPRITAARLVGNVLGACDRRDEVKAQTGHRCRVSASSLSYDAAQPERMAGLLARLARRIDEHYWLPVYGRPEHGCGTRATARKELPCWPLFTEAHITAGGRLSACPLDHSARFHVGDLTRTPFREAWHSAAMQALRAAHLAGDVGSTVCAACVGYD